MNQTSPDPNVIAGSASVSGPDETTPVGTKGGTAVVDIRSSAGPHRRMGLVVGWRFGGLHRPTCHSDYLRARRCPLWMIRARRR